MGTTLQEPDGGAHADVPEAMVALHQLQQQHDQLQRQQHVLQQLHEQQLQQHEPHGDQEIEASAQ